MLPSAFFARGREYADDVAPPKLDDFPAPWRIWGQQIVVHFRAKDIALDFLHDRPEALAATAALGTFRPFAPRPHAILIATPVCDGSPNRREHQQCEREAARGSHPGAILGQFSQ